MNSDPVAVIGTATGRVTGSVAAGRLPALIAVTPDGSRVWAGNTLSGNVTVINAAANTVAGTVLTGTGTATLDAAPLGIAFVRA
jgi:YVTN family beta-propeller protein